MEPKRDLLTAGDGAAAGKMAEPPAFSRAVVLVVDDEDLVLQLTRLMMTLEGFRVLTAEGEDDAVAQAAAFPGRIDLLLADVKLRQGTGPGTAERVSQARPEMEIVFMSGYSRTDLVGQRLIREDAAFLPKPFNTAAFRNVIRSRFPEKSSWMSAS
jgi:DNA-binding NtrC family response regulator